MFERFTRAARVVVERAQEEAREAGSRSIEAEHLLLALASSGTPVAEAMAAHGYGHEALTDALAAEEAQSLEAVGVSGASYAAARAVVLERHLRFGTSAKRTLEETVRLAAAGDAKRLEAAHILWALVLQRHGTAPRALALVDGDLQGLIGRTHELCRGR